MFVLGRFIRGFANFAVSLPPLLSKGSMFVWLPQCFRGLSDLKSVFTSSPIFGDYEATALTYIHTNASGVHIRPAVAEQSEEALMTH